jgi:hypothetical protein
VEEKADEVARGALAPLPELVRAKAQRLDRGEDLSRHLRFARRQAAVATLNPINKFLSRTAQRKARAYERLQREGPPIPSKRWDESPRFALSRIAPDGQVQNPLTQLVPLGVGTVGALLLRLRLFFVNIRLRRYLVGLNRIQGIHFARWVVFKAAGRHHLLFLSCYDGIWDGYIGAFFEDLPVRALLEQMWKGSERFAEAGRTADSFKAWILARQVPTSVFYSAHREPPLAIADIHQALQVRALVEGSRPAEELAEYLRTGSAGSEPIQLTIQEAFAEVRGALREGLRKFREEAVDVAARAAREVRQRAARAYARAVRGDARGARGRPAPDRARAEKGGRVPVPPDLSGREHERENLVER